MDDWFRAGSRRGRNSKTPASFAHEADRGAVYSHNDDNNFLGSSDEDNGYNSMYKYDDHNNSASDYEARFDYSHKGGIC